MGVLCLTTSFGIEPISCFAGIAAPSGSSYGTIPLMQHRSRKNRRLQSLTQFKKKNKDIKETRDSRDFEIPRSEPRIIVITQGLAYHEREINTIHGNGQTHPATPSRPRGLHSRVRWSE